MGKTQKDAAKLAGYSGHGANASRLDNIQLIEDRINELKEDYTYRQNARIESAQLEIEKLIDEEKMDVTYFVKELRRNLEIAREDRDVKSANDCLKYMAGMLGFSMGSSSSRGDDSDRSNGSSNKNKPVNVSIVNQLANGVDGTNRNPPQDRPAPLAVGHSEVPDQLQDLDAELTPDLGLLIQEFGPSSRNVR